MTEHTSKETLEILHDDELMAAFRQGVRDIEEGRVIPWDEVKKELELEYWGIRKEGDKNDAYALAKRLARLNMLR